MKYDVAQFSKTVTAYWKKEGRHQLPWRLTRDPYAILVSEIMLQQTQVDRVVPYFESWMRKFPTVQSLAKAPLVDVLRAWSGLGYNRRAKLLRECAKEIVERYGGKVPRDFAALVALPGIGPYTAGAISAFVFDEPAVFIETNIRAALLHHFFPRSRKVEDKKLIPILKRCLKHTTSARKWYSALMDYGSYIKRTTDNPSRRSKHHVRQSKFAGSLRQARGAILRKLLKGPISEKALLKVDVVSSYKIELALRDLEREGLVRKTSSKWKLAN
ncbi:MAG TPA: A/G-specific adenine glycosylase [Candidatus Paceibacterota bacterium]|nr:A/G-specific adenine glycosylase [Candidatus Paceibacterota bacterium]